MVLMRLVMTLVVALAACGAEPPTSPDLDGALEDMTAVGLDLEWTRQPDIAGPKIDMAPAADLAEVDLARAPDLVTAAGDMTPAADLAPGLDLLDPPAPDMAPMCIEVLALCTGAGPACCGPYQCRTDYRTGDPVSRCCAPVGDPCTQTSDCCKPSGVLVGCASDTKVCVVD